VQRGTRRIGSGVASDPPDGFRTGPPRDERRPAPRARGSRSRRPHSPGDVSEVSDACWGEAMRFARSFCDTRPPVPHQRLSLRAGVQERTVNEPWRLPYADRAADPVVAGRACHQWEVRGDVTGPRLAFTSCTGSRERRAVLVVSREGAHDGRADPWLAPVTSAVFLSTGRPWQHSVSSLWSRWAVATAQQAEDDPAGEEVAVGDVG